MDLEHFKVSGNLVFLCTPFISETVTVASTGVKVTSTSVTVTVATTGFEVNFISETVTVAFTGVEVNSTGVTLIVGPTGFNGRSDFFQCYCKCSF